MESFYVENMHRTYTKNKTPTAEIGENRLMRGTDRNIENYPSCVCVCVCVCVRERERERSRRKKERAYQTRDAITHPKLLFYYDGNVYRWIEARFVQKPTPSPCCRLSANNGWVRIHKNMGAQYSFFEEHSFQD